MEYIAAIIAFVATLVGIVGDTYDKKAKGLARVTRTGWIVVGLAAVALSVSAIQIYQKSTAESALEENKRVLRLLAIEQLGQSLLYTADAFRLLNAKYKFDSHQLIGNVGAAAWADKSFSDYISHMDLNAGDGAQSFLADGETWGHFLSRQLTRTQTRLSTTLSIYAPYLDPETVARAEGLRTSAVFQFVPEFNQLYSAGPSTSLTGAHVSVSFPGNDMSEFLKAYKNLCEHLQTLAKEGSAEPPAGTCST